MAEITEAIRLLEEALHLRMNGERAPGGNETWQQWEREAGEFLRSGTRRLLDEESTDGSE